MAIYNKSETEVFECYDIDGLAQNVAYDLDGVVVYPDEVLLKVMTYNVQWFTGINSQLAMQQSIINNYNADIIGVQEISQNGNISSVGQTVLSPYQYQRLSNHKNYIAMMSKVPLSNIVVADYINQDPNDMTQYNETRAYMTAEISAGGKTITWINTHLCLTAEYKYLQMKEVFDIMETKEYAIATGDFNIGAYTSISDSAYVNMTKQFVDAGYNVANNNGIGHTNTHTSATTATSLADLTKPHDDIITTGNIEILNVVFDTTKFNYLNGSAIDHIPVIATLKIN